MSTIPKLALIPSGYKASKVYSVLPSDGVGDFDFSRSGQATRINKDGLIETVGSNIPRLNYPMIDGVVSGCPSLLLEPQSLNQIINSENLSDGSWVKNNSTVESNSTISPDGTLNADKVTFTANNSQANIQQLSLTSVNSVSFFIKYIDLDYILVFIGGSSLGTYVNIKDGYVTNSTINGGLDITIKKYPNNWLKIEANNGNNGSNLSIYAANSTPNYSPITLNGSFYLWGVQAETNSYPTSYIPNYGTALGVTRSAETANGSGDASTFNGSEGVIMYEINSNGINTDYRLLSINDNITSNNFIQFGYANNSNQLYKQVIFNGVNIFPNVTSPINQSLFNKIAIKYKSGNSSFYVNGFEIDSSSITYSQIAVFSELKYSNIVNGDPFYGSTKQLQYFDTALNDTDLEKLTSWTSFTDLANGQQYSIK